MALLVMDWLQLQACQQNDPHIPYNLHILMLCIVPLWKLSIKPHTHTAKPRTSACTMCLWDYITDVCCTQVESL